MSLEEFCTTDRQKEIVRAYEKAGCNKAKAAKVLGVTRTSVFQAVQTVEKRAAQRGYSPSHDMLHPVPEGFVAKGVSTYYNDDGKPTAQWVKSSLTAEAQLQLMQTIVDEMKADVTKLPKIKAPKKSKDSELLNLYTLTDVHLGMLAWHEEGGADWDLQIAERTIENCMANLIARSPAAGTGFFCQLGDFLHFDGMTPKTPQSGHILDADSRYQKVVRAAIRIVRDTIRQMLAKYPKVVVLMARGNHDPGASAWLQELFYQWFDENPRVEVIVSPLPYYAYRHGEVLLAFHHGDQKRGKQLPDLMTGEFRELVGVTKKTLIHTGHLHSWFADETPSAIIERHPTLAARDSHASGGGWLSTRRMSCITYHATQLEYARQWETVL
jgi:hypothetical protein